MLKIISLIFLLLSGAALADNPFFYACQDREVEVDYLVGGFFKNSRPIRDKKNMVLSISLAGQVLDRIEHRIQGSENISSNILYCLENEDTPECFELNQWIDFEVPKFVNEARYHASLAFSNHSLFSFFMSDIDSVNEDINLWSEYKEESWSDLSDKELERAKATLSRYKEKIEKKAKEKGVLDEDLVEDKLMGIRYKHFQKYQEMTSKLNFLQFFKEANPTRQDIKVALELSLLKLKEEKSFIKKKRIEQEILINTTMDMSHSLMELWDYRLQLEEVLMTNPRFCNLAAAVDKFRNRRGLKIGLSVGLPIMATSFILPPMAGAGVGVMTGLGFALQSQRDLDSASRRSVGHIYGDDLGLESGELSSLKRMRDFEVAILPLGLGVLSSGTSKAYQVSKGLINRTNINNVKARTALTINQFKKKYSRLKLFP